MSTDQPADPDRLPMGTDPRHKKQAEPFVKNETGETARRSHSETLRAIFDQAFEFIGLMSVDGTLLMANKASLALLDLEDHEVLGKKFWDAPWWAHSSELRARLKGAVRDAAKGELVRFEAFHPLPDGVTRYVDVSVKPILEADGTIIFLIPEGRDITERKKIEEALRNSEAQHRFLVENLNDVAFSIDMKGNFSYISPVVEHRFNLSPESFVGKNFIDFVHPDDLQAALESFEGRIEGSQEPFEFQVKVGEGQYRWARVSSRPFYQDDQMAGLNGILTDISDLKSAEARLRESNRILEQNVRERTADLLAANRELKRENEERIQTEKSLRESQKHLKSILKSASGFAIYRLEFDKTDPYLLRPVFVSPSVREVLGISPETFTSDSFFDNIHPEEVDRARAANLKAFETNRFDETCRFYHRIKKRWVWIHAISTGVRDELGQVTHVNGIFIDTTAEHESEAELKKHRDQLKKKAQNLEDLNIALKVLLDQRESDKSEIESNTTENIKGLIEPLISKLKMSGLKKGQKMLVEVIQSNINGITSPFQKNLSKALTNLTPKEIQIANLIKLGKSTKEIAEIVGISHRTVDTHRRNLRAKFGLKNKKTNLRTYLLSLD